MRHSHQITHQLHCQIFRQKGANAPSFGLVYMPFLAHFLLLVMALGLLAGCGSPSRVPSTIDTATNTTASARKGDSTQAAPGQIPAVQPLAPYRNWGLPSHINPLVYGLKIWQAGNPVPLLPTALGPLKSPADLIGTSAALAALNLGTPTLLRREAPAEVWHYRGTKCALDLYVYDDESHVSRITHVDLRPLNVSQISLSACLRNLKHPERTLKEKRNNMV